MSKQKRKKQRTSRHGREAVPSRRPSAELEETLKRIDELIAADRPREAIALLEPLLKAYPRLAKVRYYFGLAYVEAGDLWRGLQEYEEAMHLSRDPDLWLPLAWMYLNLELNVHALQAFRQALRQGVDESEIDAVRHVVADLEESVQEMSRTLGCPLPQVEQGLRRLEEGIRSLQGGDYGASITANRHAAKLLPGWPPARNNLSLALFFDGQPQEAITIGRQVLAQDPENIQALSNAIRFLAWTGQEDAAKSLWTQLRAIEPRDDGELFKMVEAAAVLEQDEFVYERLNPLDRSGPGRARKTALPRAIEFCLAVAEANLGKRTARRRLKALQESVPGAGDLLAALNAGQPGLGWAERYPYFRVAELIPQRRMEEFIDLIGRQDQMPDQRFHSQMARFAERFPQFVLAAEKMIWEEKQPEAGIGLLASLGNPAAYAALRRFALSQAGDDEMRLQALGILSEADQIAPGETIRVWLKGQWQEIQPRQFEIYEEDTWEYAPAVMELLDRGLHAFQQGDYDKAERLFQQALEQDPSVKEAYNNLSAIYGRRGDTERATQMCRAALEIDPHYVLARCNLSMHLLDEGDMEGAADILKPLADVKRFQAHDMAVYSYAQARLFLYQEEYEKARSFLEMALEVRPDYEPAKELLARLQLLTRVQTGFGSFFERQHERALAKRARLQVKLATPDPSLFEALSLYTKEVLSGMGRVVLPWGGWSGLHKPELRDQILAGLEEPDNVERMVTQLDEEERAALRRVMAHGGHLPWSEFDAEYGNDLEESPYWQWHVPETTMGRLRYHGLLVEATVDGELLIVVPLELRPALAGILGQDTAAD
jgi:tetratricopeptide (TPR) repeat protein